MIRISHLLKTYISDKKVETKALRDINLTLPEKGLIFITGKTGCGKTTLLNILGKLDKPTSGRIYIGQEDITKYNRKQDDDYRNNFAGFIFQEYNLIDELTVYENIAMAQKLQGKEVEEEVIDEILSKIDLIEQRNKKCDELSGGQKQRVAIVRAIMKKPKIILADEPTGALDTKTGKEILEILKELSKETLIIVVSHDLEYAKTYGDRIIKMEDGRIVEDSGEEVEEEYTKKIEQGRGKLSIKDSFKLGMFNLNHRIKKLIVMILVSVVAFILIGVTGTFISFNKGKVVFDTMKRENVHQLIIRNVINDRNESFSKEEIQTYKSKYENKKFYQIYSIDSYRIENDASDGSADFLDNYVYNEMEINEEIANYLDLKLIIGRYPASDNEVLITDYQYEIFNISGYRYENSSSVVPIDSYADIIGRPLNVSSSSSRYVNNLQFEIVGIIDTHFELNKYLNDNRNDLDPDKYTRNEYMDRLNNSLAQTLFHNVGYLENFNKKYQLDIYTDTRGVNLYYSYEYYGQKYEEGFDVDKLAIRKYDKKGKAYYFEEHEDVLQSDEILMNWETLKKVIFSYDDKVMTIAEYITEYVIDRIEEDDISGESTTTEEKIIEYITNNNVLEFIKNVEIRYRSYNDEIQPNKTKKIKIVGIINPDLSENIFNYDILLSDELYSEIVSERRAYFYSGLCTYIDFKTDRKLVEEMYKLNKGLKPFDAYTAIVERAEGNLKKVSKICLIASIILGLFSGILFYTYITFVIDDKKKQIGILRSLGGTKKDLLKIFLTESFIIGLIISVISIIGSALITIWFNGYLNEKLSFHLKVLSYGTSSICLIICLSLVISFLATYIPISKINKLNPVDSLKANK